MKANDYKNALITGASSGLGRALAVWFAKRNVKVYACGRRAAQLESLAEEAKAFGGAIEPVQLDVVDGGAVVKTLRKIDADCGGLDLVIANAGVGGMIHSKRLTWEECRKVLEVNVMGAAATLSALLPEMVARQRGHLVGVSSLAAYRGLPRSAAYSGSKAFLVTFLEGLRVDLKKKGIRVTSIHPGFVKTEMTANATIKMPFLLEVDDAADRVGRAILRGDSEFGFPWPMSATMHLVKVLPNALFDLVGRRVM